MRMCAECWGQLRSAIEARGLTQFVAKSGEEAFARLVSGDTRAGFDPLMGAHNALVSNLLSAGGLGVMAQGGCPLCFMVAACGCGEGDACAYRTWIDRAADDQREAARALGLMGAA